MTHAGRSTTVFQSYPYAIEASPIKSNRVSNCSLFDDGHLLCIALHYWWGRISLFHVNYKCADAERN